MPEQKQDWGKTMGGGVMAVLGVMMMLVAMSTIAQAAPATTQYVDPIDGTTWPTYQDLYNHFVSAHPTVPISILWS